jgi:hypothetical protein
VRIGDPQTELPAIALRQERKSKQQDSELEQPAQWSGSVECFNDSSGKSAGALRRASRTAIPTATFSQFLQALDTHMTSEIDGYGNF